MHWDEKQLGPSGLQVRGVAAEDSLLWYSSEDELEDGEIREQSDEVARTERHWWHSKGQARGASLMHMCEHFPKQGDGGERQVTEEDSGETLGRMASFRVAPPLKPGKVSELDDGPMMVSTGTDAG